MNKWLLFSILFVAANAQAQMMCSDVMKAPVTVEQFETLTGIPVQRLVNQFKMTIRPEVLAGKEKPTWQDFEVLKQFILSVKSLKQELKDKPEAAYLLESMAVELKQVLANDPAFQNLRALQREIKQESKTYLASERELKIAYQFYVRELNRILPRDLRIPLVHFAPDARLATMNKDAAAYMKGVEKNFRRLFRKTDHKSYKKFVEQFLRSEDPVVKKAVELIEKDQIQVVMRRPENARFWVPKVGFQNQFVTGSSRGSLNPRNRNLAEQKLYNIDTLEAYSARDPEFKPKYGTLSVKPESGITPDLESSSQYGPDIYAFKTENIKDRLTFYVTDSLGPGLYLEAGNKGWESSFIPWKNRHFLIPFMLKQLASNRFRTDTADPSIVPKATTSYMDYGYRYWETQILGTVRLEDVASFTFTTPGNPPRGEFLRELLKNDITIYDGTEGLGPEQLKKWTPSAEDLVAP